MSNFVITTDSCSDLSLQQMAKLGVFDVDLVNMTVTINGKEYDGVKKSINADKLYGLMRAGIVPSTSQINPENAERFFEKYLNQGLDIIHICLSGQLSGTYNSCKIAQKQLKAKYPDRKIKVVDSLSGSLGQGILVLESAIQKKQNKSFEQLVNFVEEKKHKICHLFIVDDLGHLKRGGRISKTEAMVGSILGVKPILTANSFGKLEVIAKARGRKSAIKYMFEKFQEYFDFRINDVLAIGHGDCQEDAVLLKNMIQKEYNIKNIIVDNIGPVMGSHAGPGVLALFFTAHNRIN